MPTQIVPLTEFSDTMTSLTELAPHVINNIMKRLTYDTADMKRDVFLQPLLYSPESVSWCPLVIKQSRPERNMLKLMARSRNLSNEITSI